MKKNLTGIIFSIVAISIFAIILAVPWVLSIAGMDIDPPKDSGEIRDLAEFPATYSNDYFARINTYMNDHSPMRQSILSVKHNIDRSENDAFDVLMAPVYDWYEKKNATPEPGPGETLEPGVTQEPTPTADFSGIFGDNTEEPTEEPTPTPTEEPTATPTATPTEAPSATPEGSESSTPSENETEAPTDTPTPEPTPTPTAEPCKHEYGAKTVAVKADCTHKGREEQVCKLCGDVKTTEIPALGHSYVTMREQEASYAHDGYKLQRCTRCSSVNVADIVLRTSVPGFYDGRKPFNDSTGDAFRGMHNWLFYKGNNSIGYFQGTNVLTSSDCNYWMTTYERLHNECEKRGINVVFLIPPNKEQVYGEYMPSGITIVSDSVKREPRFVQYLIDHNSPIHYVYPLNELKTAKILYETYLQQDTHWNGVGGFVGTMQVYKSIGMDVTGIQDVDVKIHKDAYYGGDLVSIGGFGQGNNYDSYEIHYKDYINTVTTLFTNTVTSSGYSTPTGELRVVESDVNNDKKCVVIGDSFRHALTGYLSKDFSKVTLTHRGDFNTVSELCQREDGPIEAYGRNVMQDAIRELKAGDLLIVMAVERYDDGNVAMAAALADFISGLPVNK